MTLFWDKSKKRFSYEHIVSPNSRTENGLVELELYFQFLIVVGTLRTVAFQSANINSHFVGKRFWKGKLNCCPRIPVLIILSIICICDNIWFVSKSIFCRNFFFTFNQMFFPSEDDVFHQQRQIFGKTKIWLGVDIRLMVSDMFIPWNRFHGWTYAKHIGQSFDFFVSFVTPIYSRRNNQSKNCFFVQLWQMLLPHNTALLKNDYFSLCF